MQPANLKLFIHANAIPAELAETAFLLSVYIFLMIIRVALTISGMVFICQ